MSRVNVEIQLPDTLATQAKKAGLLEPEALERMVREALLARRVESLAEGREQGARRQPTASHDDQEIQAVSTPTRADVRVRLRP